MQFLTLAIRGRLFWLRCPASLHQITEVSTSWFSVSSKHT